MFSDYTKDLVFGKERWINPDSFYDGHYTLNGTNCPVFFCNDIVTMSDNDKNSLVSLLRAIVN